ncbi:MAG TPA: hypothetical protein VLN61_13785 [Pseudolabrys sp.]|nr:hypothetical protein [Pseudolabrys sp.]
MGTDTAIDRVTRDLHSALNTMRGELDRVELLAVALSVFSRPIPDYEPRFRHLPRVPLSAHELGEMDARKQ